MTDHRDAWWPTTRACPHCRSLHDISTRLHGDRVWCRFCDKWFSVVMRPDGQVYLAKCDAPAEAAQVAKPRQRSASGRGGKDGG